MTQIRLDKYLADCGCGTRSEIKKEIRAGAASVNGVKVSDGALKINPDTDEVTWHGEQKSRSTYEYVMLYKPAGCVTALRDSRHRTVMDYLPETVHKNVAPAGRLDIDTEGLLLITDDGPLVHRLLSPAHHVPKTYFVRVNRTLTDEEVRIFQEGVDIGEDRPARPAQLQIVSSGQESEGFITVTEGKFHQVKRMFAAVGMEVLYLKRVSMGSLQLDETLGPGGSRSLTEEEIGSLYEDAGMQQCKN